MSSGPTSSSSPWICPVMDGIEGKLQLRLSLSQAAEKLHSQAITCPQYLYVQREINLLFFCKLLKKIFIKL